MPEAGTLQRVVGPIPDAATVPVHLQTFLALDFGTRRTGVAFGNRLLRTARPLATIHATGGERMAQILSRVQEWQPEALVVGVPFHPDGAGHENTLLARKFARSLRGRFKLPVFEVDERYSTTEALSNGAGDPDAGAACVILEQFLRGLP
jgi:putative Holliday junction resolvase